MANLKETATWEAGIYQLETSDLVLGGADGIDNKQPRQLANRTVYLKQELENLATLVGSNGESYTEQLAALVQKDSDLSALIDALTKKDTDLTALIRQASPIGQLAYFDLDAAPKGWLWLNGAAVPIATYSALTTAKWVGASKNATATEWYRCTDAANPSKTRDANGAYLVLRDSRGEFLRAWDGGRGVDSGRVLGSSQGDAFKSHNHTLSRSYNPQGDVVQNNLGWTNDSDKVPMKMNSATTVFITDTKMIGNTGSNETRPRNIAHLLCIRAL